MPIESDKLIEFVPLQIAKMDNEEWDFEYGGGGGGGGNHTRYKNPSTLVA